MSNVEIKQAQINFWQSVIDAFYIANFSMTKEEMLKMETMKEIAEWKQFRGSWKKASETACISRAKKRVEEKTWKTEDGWKKACALMLKNGFDSHFTFADENSEYPVVKFAVNSFECKCSFGNATDFLKRWKSYKVN